MVDQSIDFVVTWVNNEDLSWRKKKERYDSKRQDPSQMNTDSRYRAFHFFKYWFRSVERYAPWVHKIYLITDNQVPEWLDVNNDKIVCVKHTDYIDSRFLPTFNSNVIEVNIHKIKGLSEQFVLFNDDTLLNAPLRPEDFFEQGLPKDVYVESPIIATEDSVAHMMVNNMEVINSNFSKSYFYRNNFTKVFNPHIGLKLFRTIALLPSRNFSGMWNSHLPIPYRKSTFERVWNLIPQKMEYMCHNKFRSSDDFSQWLMRYWQLASGKFILQKNRNWGKVYDLGVTPITELKKEIEYSKHKIICLNDTDNLNDFEYIDDMVTRIYGSVFSKKSKFERI